MPEFKLIVAGGRDFTNYTRLENELIALALDAGALAQFDVSIVSGMARGADSLAVLFAKRHHVHLHEFPCTSAEWTIYGKRAGHMRNERMGRFADGLLAFWDGKSPGTKHMINFMKSLGKPTYVINY